MPSRFSENFPDTEGEDQVGENPAADHRKGSNKAVKIVEVENKPPLPINNFKDTRVSIYGPTPHLLCKNSKNGPEITCQCSIDGNYQVITLFSLWYW